MKNSYKKISAIVLAGVVVMGASLSSASAASFKGDADAVSVIQFGRKDGFDVLEMKQSEQEMDKAIKDRVKGKGVPGSLKKRLSESAVPVNSIGDYEKLLKSGMRLNKIKVGDWYYLIRVDEVSIFGASREPQHKFYKKVNQRSYDSVDLYSRKYKYDIVFVEDFSSSALSVEMGAKIRSKFGHNPKVKDELLKGANKVFKDVDSFISNIKSGDNIFKKLKSGEYYRFRVGDLEYVIRKK